LAHENDTGDRRPSHRLYHVAGEGESARWTQIGASWPNRDGKGFNLALDAIPLHGRVVMRELSEREEQSGEAE